MFKMKRFVGVLPVVIASVVGTTAFADVIEFDFKDPKRVNSIMFIADSRLEPIMGLATGISGKVELDFVAKGHVRGRIVVDARSIRCSLPAMTKVLHSKEWLDVENFPTIELVFTQVQGCRRPSAKPNLLIMSTNADLTIKGITRDVFFGWRVTYLKDELGNRLHKKTGDLVAIRSKFKINRSDFNIKPDADPEIVAEEIEIVVRIVGSAPKKGPTPKKKPEEKKADEMKKDSAAPKSGK